MMNEHPPATAPLPAAGPTAREPEAACSQEAVAGIPWMIASKTLLIFVYFAISILTVRWLGKERFGVFSFCKSAAELLVMVCALGLNTGLVRFIPELVIHRNRAGLRRLLGRSALLQAGAASVALAGLVLLTPVLGRWFHAEFGAYLALAGLVVFAQLAKDFLNDTFTALFKSKTVALMSIGQALLWLGWIAVGLHLLPTVGTALWAQIGSIAVVAGVGSVLLARHLRTLNWRSPPMGIGRTRALALALPTLLNASLRMLMMKYTEVFFLGLYHGTLLVGYYELGYSTPFVVLTLIPTALQTLLSAAFADAYSRNPASLDRLVGAVYKLLILVMVPVSVFGLFFSRAAIVIVYGEAMRQAGPVCAAFSVLHVLGLISMPLSMAITAREKVASMLPYLVLQVAMNLALDVLLIPRWGLLGAVAAVALTFVLTIPFRLHAVRRLIGGINFPMAYFLRVLAVCLALAGTLAWTVPTGSLLMLALTCAAYGVLLAVAFRVLGVLRAGDVTDLGVLGTPSMNRVVAWLAGPRARAEARAKQA